MTVNYIYWTVRPEIFTAGPFTVGTAGMWIFAAICALIIILDRVALSKAMARWKADGNLPAENPKTAGPTLWCSARWPYGPCRKYPRTPMAYQSAPYRSDGTE